MHGLLDKLRKANAPQAKPMDVLNGEESHAMHTSHLGFGLISCLQ